MYQLRLILALLVTSTFNSSFAQTTEDHLPVHAIISEFSQKIYVSMELTGPDAELWSEFEEDAIAQLDTIDINRNQALTAQDEKGRTPLGAATLMGMYFFADALLNEKVVRDSIEVADNKGLTAYSHALIAYRQTLLACHPDVDNPFVIIPFYIKQPYYKSRNPYPQLLVALSKATANTDQEPAKESWLEYCTNSDESDRALVRNSVNLQADLLSMVRVHGLRAVEIEIEEMRPSLEELVELGIISTDEMEEVLYGIRSSKMELFNN